MCNAAPIDPDLLAEIERVRDLIALAIRASATLHGVVEKQCREAIRALNPELTKLRKDS